jgi:hypothetical protein
VQNQWTWHKATAIKQDDIDAAPEGSISALIPAAIFFGGIHSFIAGNSLRAKLVDFIGEALPGFL